MIQDTAALDSIVAQIAFWSEFFSKLLGFVDVRAIASASQRIRCALLGSEDLANDLNAERGPDAIELDYARRRFILECRAVKVEPIDAPYTFSDVEGAVTEARYARRLGYRSKEAVANRCPIFSLADNVTTARTSFGSGTKDDFQD